MSNKRLIRSAALSARRARTPADTRSADEALVRAAVEIVRGHHRIAAYAPMPGEPGGAGLVEALAAEVDLVILPILAPDLDLDWARYEGAGEGGGEGESGLGPPLGRSAIATVELVLVPALAVDRDGNRLGRGGGSYDRALARVADGTPVIAVLYDGELLQAVPAESHDRQVTAVLTPSGLVGVSLPMA